LLEVAKTPNDRLSGLFTNEPLIFAYPARYHFFIKKIFGVSPAMDPFMLICGLARMLRGHFEKLF
jgi:hypothetical protein